MTATHVQQDRITFSLPSTMNHELDRLKDETSRSKSELIQTAIAGYLRQQKLSQWDKAVELALSDETYLAELEAWDSLGDELYAY